MTTSSVQPLFEADLDRLESWLNDAAHAGMALDEVHGFLTAVVSGPEVIPPQRWLPLVFGGQQEARQHNPPEDIVSLLLRLNSEISLALFGQHHFEPWLREHPGVEGDAPLPVPEGWCMGYLEGVNLYPLDWRRTFFHNEEAQRLLIPVMAFGYIDHDNPDESPRPQTDQEQRELAGLLPDAVKGLFAWWREQQPTRNQPTQVINREAKIGRNAPCPCGSGKKYKKCCGAISNQASK